jgi:hypothetical protein
MMLLTNSVSVTTMNSRLPPLPPLGIWTRHLNFKWLVFLPDAYTMENGIPPVPFFMLGFTIKMAAAFRRTTRWMSRPTTCLLR